MNDYDDQPRSALESALQKLQSQRTACVARLTAVLERDGRDAQIEHYLTRIDVINAALIRLASAEMVG
ncbi:MAG: hypothetical protein AB7L90_25085 [Hyphomicrobiaceae bacterium]